MPTTTKLKLPIPDPGRVPTPEEVKLTRDILDITAQADWGVDLASTAGHTLVILGGVVPIGGAWTRVPGASFALAANTTRFVERMREADTLAAFGIRLVDSLSPDTGTWIPVCKAVAGATTLEIEDMRPTGGTLQGPRGIQGPPGPSGSAEVQGLSVHAIPRKGPGGTLVDSGITDDGITVGVSRALEVMSDVYIGIRNLGGLNVGGKYYRSMFIGKDMGTNASTGFGHVYDSGNPSASFAYITPWGNVEGFGLKVASDGNVSVQSLRVVSAVQSTSTTTGALVVGGGVGVGGNVNATGAIRTTDYVGVTRDGAAHEVFAPLSITRAHTADRTYLSLTRSGQYPWGIGILASNSALAIGQALSLDGGFGSSALTLTIGGDLTLSGNVNLCTAGKSYQVAGIQVLGPRQTGWTAGTGTANKGAFNADTATNQQTAQRLLALEQAIWNHGSIGA